MLLVGTMLLKLGVPADCGALVKRVMVFLLSARREVVVSLFIAKKG